MAIQLDCPACFSTTRVPDAAVDTVVSCPKCREKMRVPKVTIPVAQPVAAPFPLGDVFAEPAAAPGESPFFTGDDDDEGPATPINPHAVLAKRNRRRMSRGWIGVIAAFVLAAAGITGTWIWSNRQNVVRTADARVIANATLSKDLASTELNVATADWGAMTKSLEVNPVELKDPRMRVNFSVGSRGLQISLTPTTERILVSVPTAAIAELTEATVQTAMHDAWKQDVSHGLTQISAAMQKAVAAGIPPSIGSYGEVGIDCLAGPKGYHFLAAVGSTAYPCVFEDANQQLYFLVPPGTQSLAVIPRDVGARKVLPEKMRITATVK